MRKEGLLFNGFVLVAHLVFVTPVLAQPVNLLHSSGSVVAVSSRVENDRILPSHLVDNDLRTAWNSRSGDLEGAWVAFSVPAEARVEAIELTAGSVATEASFLRNVRVAKVRVLRNEQELFQAELEIQDRGLQRLDVGGAAGGDFRIEILEVVRGTERRFREVCISELVVLGTVPSPRTVPPEVRVGSLAGEPERAISEARAALRRARAELFSARLEDGGLSEVLAQRRSRAAARVALRRAELAEHLCPRTTARARFLLAQRHAANAWLRGEDLILAEDRELSEIEARRAERGDRIVRRMRDRATGRWSEFLEACASRDPELTCDDHLDTSLYRSLDRSLQPQSQREEAIELHFGSCQRFAPPQVDPLDPWASPIDA